MAEKKKAKEENLEVQKQLDNQKNEVKRRTLESRENDLSIGVKMVNADLEQTTREN